MSAKTKTRLFTAFLEDQRLTGNLVVSQKFVSWARGVDTALRRDLILKRLHQQFPDIDFVGREVIGDYVDLYPAYDMEDIDGVLLIDQYVPPLVTAPWYKGDEEVIAPFRKKPMILTHDMALGCYTIGYSGLPFAAMAAREGLPVLPIVGTSLSDMFPALHLAEVVHRMKEAKILVLGIIGFPSKLYRRIFEQGGISTSAFPQMDWILNREQHFERIEEVFGTRIVHMPGKEFRNNYYKKVSDEEAERLADAWISGSMGIRGPSRQEIVDASRWPPALMRAVEDTGCDAVTLMEGVGGIKQHPCLGMRYLKDNGIPCSPTASLDGSLAQLLMLYLTGGQAGMLNEMHADPPRRRIMHSWCCGPGKWEGPGSQSSPYEIRHCCIGGTSCANDPRHIYGREVTGVYAVLPGNMVIAHSGILQGRLPRGVAPNEMGDNCVQLMGSIPGDFSFEQIGCLNKFVIEVSKESMKRFVRNNLAYWDMVGAHRCLYVGDHRDALQDLCALLGLRYVDELEDELDYEEAHSASYHIEGL